LCRANATTLVIENERLQGSLQGTERDTIEVIAYLKNEIKKQRKLVEDADERCKVMKRECREDVEQTEARYQKLLSDEKERLAEEVDKGDELRDELSRLKEFSSLRTKIEKELADVKAANVEIQRNFETELETRETKFYEEKVRMRVEAEAEISALAERAHASAVAGLDETTRNTYKENVRLEEELHVNKLENTRLAAANQRMITELTEARSEAREASMTMHAKVASAIKTDRMAKELKDKVSGLEKALGHCIREFEHEKSLMTLREAARSTADTRELSSLAHALELKTAETRRIRHLARNILVQRSEIESFFLDSLNRVKQEIARSRATFTKETKARFNKQVADAASGIGVLPPIQTFSKAASSTASLYDSFEEAGELPPGWMAVDPKDFTWEQRERVLRMMLAQMATSRTETATEPADPDALHTGDPAQDLTGIRPLPVDLNQFTMTLPDGTEINPLAITGTDFADQLQPSAEEPSSLPPPADGPSFFLTEASIAEDVAVTA
jgi:hypothetical protein